MNVFQRRKSGKHAADRRFLPWLLAGFDQRQRISLINRCLHQIEVREVLDVGAGPGLLASYLQSRGYEVTSLDIDLASMQCFHRFGRVVGDGCQLPFADASFDCVVSTDVLEHLRPAKRIALLRELSRVSRKHLLFSYSMANSRWRLIRLFLVPVKLLNGEYPTWYVEHNAVESPSSSEISEILGEIQLKSQFEKRYQGSLSLFLLGMMRALWTSRTLRFATSLAIYSVTLNLLNCTAWVLVSCIDFPPHCSVLCYARK